MSYGSMLKKSGSKGIFTGPILTIEFIGYELLIYVFNRYLGIVLPNISGISAMGFITFFIILLKDYWQKTTNSMLEEQENQMLRERAYIDGLTKMGNRRYCVEYMANITQETDNYTIVSFDLNSLKQTNDIYGHVKGDVLVKQAAKAITDSFGKSGVVGRMGGDEFIAILKDVKDYELEKIINDFHNAVAEANSKDRQLNLSMAFGIASSYEFENCDNVEKVYNIADKRMYVNKRKLKEYK